MTILAQEQDNPMELFIRQVLDEQGASDLPPGNFIFTGHSLGALSFSNYSDLNLLGEVVGNRQPEDIGFRAKVRR